MSDVIVCFSTASSAEEAAKIARALVEERLAACVNILPAVRSIFSWEGKIEDASEAMLVIKSRRSLLDPLVARIRALHTYTVPEVIALDVEGGSADYLAWVLDSTLGPRRA